LLATSRSSPLGAGAEELFDFTRFGVWLLSLLDRRRFEGHARPGKSSRCAAARPPVGLIESRREPCQGQDGNATTPRFSPSTGADWGISLRIGHPGNPPDKTRSDWNALCQMVVRGYKGHINRESSQT
jgi:hypothetical protein